MGRRQLPHASYSSRCAVRCILRRSNVAVAGNYRAVDHTNDRYMPVGACTVSDNVMVCCAPFLLETLRAASSARTSYSKCRHSERACPHEATTVHTVAPRLARCIPFLWCLSRYFALPRVLHRCGCASSLRVHFNRLQKPPTIVNPLV